MGFLIKFSEKYQTELDNILPTAVDYIKEGKIIAFPTNTEYKIGGDPHNSKVIERIFQIKFRETAKGLPLLFLDSKEAQKVASFNEMALKLADKFWPGQLKLILRKKVSDVLPEYIATNRGTLSLQIPENPIILDLLQRLKTESGFGGLIATSASYSGDPPMTSGAEVARKFLTPIGLILDAGKTKKAGKTTIIDCTTEEPKIIRIGKISEEEILNVLENS